MNQPAPVLKDLLVLCADIQQEKTIATLLETRCESLHVRKPSYDIFRHSEHDPGVYKGAGNFLNVFVDQFHYALVILDAAWEGSPAIANEIAPKIQSDLDENGWENRSRVIVIDPELEIWVWANSPHVPEILGMNWETIRGLAKTHDHWQEDAPKPHHPKELLEELLEETNKRRSSAFFMELAKKVGLERCQDPAFGQFREILREWFPEEPRRLAVRERRAPYRRKQR